MLDELDTLADPVIQLYQDIELDLLREVARRFATYEEFGGSLEWQTKKLDELGGLNSAALKIIERQSGKQADLILSMLERAGHANFRAEFLKDKKVSSFLSDPERMMNSPAIRRTVQHSYRELNESFRLIQTKAIESTRQSYMDVLNTAYLEVSSGTYDYNTSIRNALQKMAAKGISGATYTRGNRIVRYSLEGTVRRDVLTAVHQTANRAVYETAEEEGIEYVYVTEHLGARVSETNHIANHAGWQGKVYKIHGFDRTHGNLKNNTGYPGDIQGLGGVNCRHRMFPWHDGPPPHDPLGIDPEENKKRYELSQKQRAKERNIRKLQKQKSVAEVLNDTHTVKDLKKELAKARKDLQKFCKDNDLRRDWNRERIEKGKLQESV